MKDFVKALVNLLKVKTIVTFVVTAVYAILAIRGDIPAEVSMTIITMVMAFYFGTQHEKNDSK